MDTAVDNDELARFREAWKAEVRSKTAAVTSPTRTKEEGNSSEAPPEPGSPLLESKSAAPAESEATMAPVDLYRRAVHAEEEGRLDEALRLYRKAFRRDPRVDKAFHREEVARAAALPPASPMEKHPTGVDKADSALAGAISTLSLAPYPTGAAELDALLAEFPPNLMFSPQDDRYSSPLEAMPLEILLQVLLQLAYNQDILAIERFAGVCRKARSVSLDPAIWR
jgi:F-box protein 9